MPQPNANVPSELVGEVGELRALARRLVSVPVGDADAEDLTQEVMVTALTQSRPPQSLRPWLRRVLRNEVRAQTRSTVRRRTREQRVDVASPAPALEDDVAQAQIVMAMREAMVELDAPYRDALQARFFDDQTAADIARSEGCPAATVRWRVQEGLRRMRRKMDERFGGRGQWMGGLAVFAGVPSAPPVAASTTGGTTMTKMTLLKIAIALAVAGGGAAAATTVTDDVTPTHAQEVPAAADSGRMQASSQGEATRTEGVAAQFGELVAGSEAAKSLEPAATGPACEDCEQRGGTAFDISPEDVECLTKLDGVLDGSYEIEIEFGAVGDDSARIADVRLLDEDPTEDGLLADCLQNVFGGRILEGLGGETEEARMTLTFGDPDIPGPDLLREGGDFSGKSVDADAPDPESIAKSLGLSPRGATKDPVVSIVECGEFDCPFCKKARKTIDRIVADYGDKVAVYWLHNPLAFHEGAEPAARAAIAAGEQGSFWEMSDLLFDNPDHRSRPQLKALAGELGLDLGRFERDFDSEKAKATIAEHQKTCTGNGARGTPSFFINGDILVGAQPYERFKALIEDELGD